MKNRTKALCLALLPVSLFAEARAVASPPVQYHVTDLGTLGGAGSAGVGINASGQVSGTAFTADGNLDAFLWTPTIPNGASGTMLDVGGGIGSGINDSAEMTGESDGNAFLYDGTMHQLDMPDGSIGSSGRGVNASGHVAGYYYTDAFNIQHAFLYDGAPHDLGTLDGTNAGAFGINASGQVTGYSSAVGDTENHAFLYDGAMHDLGTLGGYSYGFGINDNGQVVGESYLDTMGGNASHAFLWTPSVPNGAAGMMHDLGTLADGLQARGIGINNAGQVVGYSLTANDGTYHAFLDTTASGMVDLNGLIDPLSGWELEGGGGINDAGQITGSGLIGGEEHAFLLTPVPEPSSLALAAVGVLGLVAGVRLRATSRIRLIVGMAATIALCVSLVPAPASASTVKTSDGNGADTELRETSGITRGGAKDLNTRNEASPSNMELIALRFDLSGINPALIDHAQLQSSVDRTGMPANNGLQVYGLNADIAGQNWTEGTANGVWNAANPFPGLTYDGSAATLPINPVETTYLNTITWSTAPAQGSTITFDDPALTAFLRGAGPLATLYLFRDSPAGAQIRLASKETVTLGQTGTGQPIGTGEFAPRLSFDVLPSNSLLVQYEQSGSVNVGLNGDSATLSGVSGKLTLPPEVPVLGPITNVDFNVAFGDEADQTFDISRELVINGVHGTLSQEAELRIGSAADLLIVGNGGVTRFELGAAGSVDVRPLALDPELGLLDSGTATGTIQAQFIYHPANVSEPAGFALAVIGVLGFATVARGQRLLTWS